ncbi:hypothetical protein CRE_17163 [Caenorhabditis remanei]|uniref:Uncharacterized protein n=1 Tax=Caenorhabditis remanei TaxID=31234 RepID=E3MAG8_CAERE|nr:hypothetical protein CRE_17163 [Caenorhabditis remanei]
MSYYLHDVFFDKRRTYDFDVDEDPEDQNKPMSHWQRNIRKRLLGGDEVKLKSNFAVASHVQLGTRPEEEKNSMRKTKMMFPGYNIGNLIVIPHSKWKMDEMRPTPRLEMLVYPVFNTPFEEKKPDGTSVVYDTIPLRKFQRIHHQGESKEQQVEVYVPAKPSMQPELEDFRAGIIPFKSSGDNCKSGDIYQNIIKILQPSKF